MKLCKAAPAGANAGDGESLLTPFITVSWLFITLHHIMTRSIRYVRVALQLR